jgi:hypothetical protein
VWLACPPGRACPARLRLVVRGRRIAKARATVPAGAVRHVALKLRRDARRRLKRAGAQRAVLVAKVAVRPGDTTTVRREIRLLAPRRQK